MEIRPGQAVALRNMRVLIQDGAGWMEFKAPKGKAFALLLMGLEDIKGEDKITPDDFLKSMGWTPPAVVAELVDA